MPQTIKLQNGDTLTVPDTYTPQQIQDAVDQHRDLTSHTWGQLGANALSGAQKAISGMSDTVRGLGAGAQALLSGGGSVLANPEQAQRDIVNNPAVKGGLSLASGQGLGDAAKQFGHSLTWQGMYEDPVGGVLNAVSLADPLMMGGAAAGAKLGRGLEAGSERLMAKTLGTPVENQAQVLRDAGTMLDRKIPRSAVGMAQTEQALAPLQAQKTAALDVAPRVGVQGEFLKNRRMDFKNLNELIGKTAQTTANDARPNSAAQSQLDSVMSDPNLFDKRSITPTDDEVLAMLKQGVDPSSIGPAESTTPIKRPLSFYDNLATDAANSARGDSGPAGTARGALASDWQNFVSKISPQAGQLNEQMAPLQSIQRQLGSALETRGDPHYGNAGALLGAVAGYPVGHIVGHPYYGSMAGASLGGAMGTPYGVTNAVAQGAHDLGGTLTLLPNQGLSLNSAQAAALADALKQQGIHHPDDFWSPRPQKR
jgi:hypothetical protein